MSGIQGITFDNQSVTAKDHGQLFHSLLSDGIISGCTLSKTSTSITIAKGYILICGRLIKFGTAQTISVPTPSATGFVRLVIAINLSGTATTTTFNQVTITSEFATSVSLFRTLTKGAINDSGTLYEYEFCIYNASTSGIGTVYRQPEKSSIDMTVLETLAVAAGGTGRATLAANNVLLGNGTNAVGMVAPGAAGQVLKSNGSSSAPSFGSISVLGTITTGVWHGSAIGMPYGGTGASNGPDGLKNLFASGATVLSVYQFGNTLPNAGLPGRIFFKTVG